MDGLLNAVRAVSGKEVMEIECSLPKNFAHSYKAPTLPEQSYCRANLAEFLTLVENRPLLGGVSARISMKGGVDLFDYFTMHLMKPTSSPECSIVFHKTGIRAGLVAAEAKTVYNTGYPAMAQAVALAGDFAMSQVSSGLALWNDVLVPFVLSFGDCLQIGAVYIIEDNFPCAALLTGPLSLMLPADRDELSRWVVALSQHCLHCDELFALKLGRADDTNRCRLISSRLFLKPIQVDDFRLASFAATQLLSSFRLLYDRKACWEFMEFPLGLMGMPDGTIHKDAKRAVLGALDAKFKEEHKLLDQSGLPIVIYRRLGPEWLNCEEHLEKLVDVAADFVKEVESVFQHVLDAGLIHLDGRLGNFMCTLPSAAAAGWKVKVKLIDWDSCARVGHKLPDVLVRAMEGDPRYPDDNSTATAVFHDHFVKQIEDSLVIAKRVSAKRALDQENAIIQAKNAAGVEESKEKEN